MWIHKLNITASLAALGDQVFMFSLEIQRANEPLVCKREGGRNEYEVENKHGHSHHFGHFPIACENRKKHEHEHTKEKCYGADHAIACHGHRLAEHQCK